MRAFMERNTQYELSEESRKLDSLLDELEAFVGGATQIFGTLEFRYIHFPLDVLGTKVHDWKPVWAKIKEIQAIFNSGVRYPTKSLRDDAWTRFNNLRNETSQKANADRESVFSVSTAWRDTIIGEIESARYSAISDVLFFFDPTTAEDMKRMGELLKEAGHTLSNNKGQMLREHKDECFQRIQEVRQTHDAFWEQYKAARERRQQEYRQKVDDVLARVEGNITNNLERKAKAESALLRVEENIEKLQGMIASAYTDEFRERFEGWLSKAEERRDSINQSIRRIDEWIDQDERRRNDIYAKRR
jgi:hypothetical protein